MDDKESYTVLLDHFTRMFKELSLRSSINGLLLNFVSS